MSDAAVLVHAEPVKVPLLLLGRRQYLALLHLPE